MMASSDMARGDATFALGRRVLWLTAALARQAHRALGSGDLELAAAGCLVRADLQIGEALQQNGVIGRVDAGVREAEFGGAHQLVLGLGEGGLGRIELLAEGLDPL